MGPKKINQGSSKKVMNKGAWTSEEDRKLVECIAVHGAQRWKIVASKSGGCGTAVGRIFLDFGCGRFMGFDGFPCFSAGLNRCGKSCRLRWLNYLRPNIKRGNISDDEEDLILRLHKLLGNRWDDD